MSTFNSGIFTQMSFANYKAAEGVNNSLLQKQALSAANAYAYLHDTEEASTEAQIFGSLGHTALLEPVNMQRWSIKPKDMSFATTEGKAWKAANATRTIVPYKDHETIKRMVDAVYSHPAAGPLMKLKAKREASAFALDPETGLLLKGRFDVLPEDEPIIIDVKTTADARKFQWERDCAKYSYHCQAAFYSDLRKLLIGPATAFFFIAVEKTSPFNVMVYQIGDFSLEKGRAENRRLLNEYAQCLKENKWPGYCNGVIQFDIPKWKLEEMPMQEQHIYHLN